MCPDLTVSESPSPRRRWMAACRPVTVTRNSWRHTGLLRIQQWSTLHTFCSFPEVPIRLLYSPPSPSDIKKVLGKQKQRIDQILSPAFKKWVMICQLWKTWRLTRICTTGNSLCLSTTLSTKLPSSCPSFRWFWKFNIRLTTRLFVWLVHNIMVDTILCFVAVISQWQWSFRQEFGNPAVAFWPARILNPD